MREAPPRLRVHCSNRVGDKDCNAYLGRRASVSEDREHQWRACTDCSAHICQACEAVQTDDNRNLQNCAFQNRRVDAAMLRSDNRGVTFQICPKCETFTGKPELCNEIDCICDTHYCFICGKEKTPGHWASNRGGCPRWYHSDDPRAWGDNQWSNWRNEGGFDFPPLKPGNSRWQESAEAIVKLDNDARIWRRINIEADESTVEDVQETLLLTRQLLTMASNRENSPVLGLVYRTPHPNQILERFRFSSHASLFRFIFQQHLHMQDKGHLLPEGSGQYSLDLFQALRRLRLRIASGGDDSTKTREADLGVLLLLLDDRLFDTDASLGSRDDLSTPERQMRELTAEVLRLCKQFVMTLQRHAGGAVAFSTSLSFYLLHDLDKLRSCLKRVHEMGEANFRNTGPDQVFALDIGTFFAYRLFEEEPDELNLVHEDDEEPVWAWRRIWLDDLQKVLDEVRIEQPKLIGEVDGGKILLLDEYLDILRKAVRLYAPGPDSEIGTATYALLHALEGRFNNLVTGGDVANPLIPDGKLRPLFFEAAQMLNEILTAYNFDPDAVVNRQETQRHQDWIRARRFCRQVQSENRARPIPQQHFELLLHLRSLTFTVARVDYEETVPHIERLRKVVVMRHYRRFWTLVRQHDADTRATPRVLWYPPLQRTNLFVQLAVRMRNVMRQVPGMLEIEHADVQGPNVMFWQLTRTEWSNDSIFFNRLRNDHQDAMSHYGRTLEETEQGPVLAIMVEVLPRIISCNWREQDEDENPQRLRTLRAFRDSFQHQRQSWQPRIFLDIEWRRVGRVIRNVIKVLERLFPEGTQEFIPREIGLQRSRGRRAGCRGRWREQSGWRTGSDEWCSSGNRSKSSPSGDE